MSPSDSRHERAAFLAIVCVGLYATSLGPALPSFARRLDVSLDTAGLLVTALFAGSITASGVLAARPLPRATAALTAFGLAAIGGGLIALGAATNWWVAVAATVFLGIGDGLVVAATHTLVAATSRDVAAGVNRLNLFFTFGAVAGPLWFGFAQEGGAGIPLIYVALAILPLALALSGALAARTYVPRRSAEDGHGSPLAPARLALLGLILFLYVGAEFGLGLWLASYTERVAGAGALAASLVTAGYWLALAFGRLASGRLFASGRPIVAVLGASIAGSLVSSVLLVLLGGSALLGGLAAFATGLFFGPIWPAVLALASERDSAGAPARLVTIGNAGALVLPWLQGRLLVGAGAREGIALTVALTAGMLFFLLVDRATTSMHRVQAPR